MAQRASLPLEPLLSIVTRSAGTDMSTTEFARRIGTTTVAVNRWQRQGGIPWVSADEAAISIGLHPLLVWGDAWLNVKGDFDKLAAQAERDLERQMVDAIETESTEDDQ